MKKFSVVFLVIVAITLTAGISTFSLPKDSQLWQVCDAISVIGFLAFFAAGCIGCAINFKEVQKIKDPLQRFVMTTLMLFAGISGAMGSIGTGTLMAIAKWQHVASIRALPFYGHESGLLCLTVGIVFFFTAKHATRKIPAA